MPLLAGRAVAELREEDLQTLIGNATEGRVLDFKREVGANDEAKREFLADVSSLANTAGGHIVIGMDEDQGVASALPGVTLPNVESEKLRLEAVIRDGLDPRLPSVAVKEIDLDNGNYALVVDVGHSWLAPHVVSFRNYSRFFARNSAGKFQMDVREIRSAILGGETRFEQIRQFHRNRVHAIEIGHAIEGGALESRKGILLHLFPLGAFDIGTQHELGEEVLRDPEVRPLYSQPGYPPGRFNLDGIFVSDAVAYGRAATKQYLQIYRNGVIESFDSRLLNYRGEDRILSYPVERTLIDDTHRFLAVAERIGVAPPILILVTIVGAAGRIIIDREEPFPGDEPPRVDRDVLPLPEVVVESLDTDTSKALRPPLDALWQAAGHPRSPNYVDGEWQRRDR